MRVLDLFSGLGGFSSAFKERGHEVVTVDIEPKFNPDLVADILNIEPEHLLGRFGYFNIILASPPCDCFSVASIYRHWNNKTKMPTDEKTQNRIALILHTIKLIHGLKPMFWVMENPRGMMRKIIGMPHYQITQCQYGKPVMKPTDLWGRLPKSFKPKRCKNGDPCHQSAPRGSKTGTQGINVKAFKKNRYSYVVKGGGGNSSLRAIIPYGLSLAICEAVEKELLQ